MNKSSPVTSYCFPSVVGPPLSLHKTKESYSMCRAQSASGINQNIKDSTSVLVASRIT